MRKRQEGVGEEGGTVDREGEGGGEKVPVLKGTTIPGRAAPHGQVESTVTRTKGPLPGSRRAGPHPQAFSVGARGRSQQDESGQDGRPARRGQLAWIKKGRPISLWGPWERLLGASVM